MTIKIYKDLDQGSDEWLAARCGLLTASEMKLILTPTLKIANNDKTRAHVYEILAQRITRYVEPRYISDDMLRGTYDEHIARDLYEKHYSPVEQVGFITNSGFGFTLGYSPDSLVGKDGAIEIKSRLQKYQVQAIANDEIPSEHILQLQTGLLVSGRKWIDYVQYCGGMPLFVKRVYPDNEIQQAIILAANDFEERIRSVSMDYFGRASNFIPTERIEHNYSDEVEL